MPFRLLTCLLIGIWLPLIANAQETAPDSATSGSFAEAEAARPMTGGGQTLEDILARQQGLQVNDQFRRDQTGDPNSAASTMDQLGTLGGASDADVYRSIRFGTATDLRVSSNGPAASVLIQDGGMKWLKFREGPLAKWGGIALLAMIVLLLLFYLLRGRIRIDGEKTGRTVLRFNFIERFAHWLTAGSFVLLGLTGLISIFGRKYLIPTFGHDAFSTLATGSKWIHNNVSWAFMVGLVMLILFWTIQNIPRLYDLKWIALGGGLFSKNVHPPAGKFNAGQKGIFWIVVIFGISISISGLSLIFPFQMPLFAKTFAILNDTGLPQWVGYGALPVEMAPHEEMQLAQAWHAIVGFAFMAVIIAHIYIGTLGMEGAFDAMGSGEVEEQWAREHHNLWLEKLEAKGKSAPHDATPAE